MNSKDPVAIGFRRWLLAMMLILTAIFHFYSPAFFIALKKLLRNKPAIIISEAGILDDSDANPYGFIPWRDIDSMIVHTKPFQRCLVLKTHHPEEYIRRQKNVYKRKMMLKHCQKYSSPLVICSFLLNIRCEELKRVAENKWMASRLYSLKMAIVLLCINLQFWL